MLTHSQLFDLYYKVDRKNTKLDNECLLSLYKIKQKLGIKIVNDFGVVEPQKQDNKFVNNNIDASLDKVIGTIRTNLNKLSEKTFDKLSENILSIIKNYDDNVFFKDVSCLIFDIVSKNKVNCSIFSKLYSKLCNENDQFKNILKNEINNYCDSFKDIKYFSPNEDYDKYCEYIKINDNKTTLSLFFLECFRQEIIGFEEISILIRNTIELFDVNIKHADNHSVCEGIVNNIFILLKGLYSSNSDEIKIIIESFTSNNYKECSSFNNKIRFKLMDINDILK